MKFWLWRRSISLHCGNNGEGGSLTGDFEGKLKFCFYQGMCRRRIWKRVSLTLGALLGDLGGRGDPFIEIFER